jgi:hypothetical protein
MTSRTDIAISLARSANPVERDPDGSAWADAEGRAAFERIIADPRTAPASTAAARLRRPTRRRPTRRRLALGVGLAAAAGGAVALVGLPGAPNHGGTPAAAAWAVTPNADGSVSVVINEYRDAAGLQAKLRAAGLRANVTAAPSKCALILPDGGELAQFYGDISTFRAPYTWQRLFAGSSSWITQGPGRGIAQDSGGKTVTLPGGEVMPAHLTFTIHPDALPAGDDVNIGYISNKALLVDVEKTGTPLQCTPPPVSIPPDTSSTPQANGSTVSP